MTTSMDASVMTMENQSIHSQAMASNQPIQIVRPPSATRRPPRQSIIDAFFHDEGEEDQVVYETTVHAPNTNPSLSGMRKSLQQRPTSSNGNAANSPTSRRNPIPRSATETNPVSFFFPSMDNNSSSTAYQKSPLRKSKSYDEHKETLQRLSMKQHDLDHILDNPKAFAKLQGVLRRHGAVTNEMLKQVLPMYVKHEANKRAAAEAARQREEEEWISKEQQDETECEIITEHTTTKDERQPETSTPPPVSPQSVKTLMKEEDSKCPE